MTIAELARAIESKKRQHINQLKEKASFDYVMADLIGKSISRIYSSSSKMPSIAEAYPTLFSQEQENQIKQEQQDTLSALRFKQFAASFNKRFKEVKAE